MTCKTCEKDITGNFIVLGLEASLQDQKLSTAKLPENTTLHAYLNVTSHSGDNDSYESIHLFDRMKTFGTDQAEQYFCSKQCLITWIEEQLEELPNP
jgi:hypothetical protein